MAEIDRYFSRIERFDLPFELLEETVKRLREEGQLRVESIVFWLGSVNASTAVLSSLVVPKGPGVLKQPFQVRVSEDVIARVCELLDPPQLVLLGQVHTHMRQAFHSPTDDRYSIGTPGYLSIVIPDFASAELSRWHAWGFHECDGPSRFRRLCTAEVRQRFAVTGDLISVHVVEG